MFWLNIYLNCTLIGSAENLRIVLNTKYARNIASSSVILILHLSYR